MLPLINLKAGELFSFDALPSAENLMPEAASAIDGEFAELLQLNVAEEFSPLLPAGDLLPERGNDLPPDPRLIAVDGPISPQGLQALPDAMSLRESDGPLRVDSILEQMLGDSGRQSATIPNVQSAGLADSKPSASDTTTLATNAAAMASADSAESRPVNGLLEQASLARQPGADFTYAISANARSTLAGSATAEVGSPIAAPGNADPRVHNQERPAPGLLQQAQSIDLQLAASIESSASNPAAGHAEPRLNAVSDQLRQQRSRSPVTAQITSAVPEGDEQARILAEEIAALPPRPAAATASTIATATVDPATQADTAPRFGNELTAALGRQAQAAIPTAVTTSIEVPVQQPGWDAALADRVTLMANGKLQNAEIRLTPAELGPLKIQLTIDDGTAHVSFQAQHGHTREAIEQALPRLREMLAESGLLLGQTSVSDDGVNQRGRDGGENARSHAGVAENASDDSESPELRQERRQLDGLVDTFA